MLEEKNDNLLEADGNLGINSPEMIQTETAVLEDLEIVETTNNETTEQVEEIAPTIVDGEIATVDAIVEEQVIVDSATPVEPLEAFIETAFEESSDNTTIIDAIADTNAEESEDETLKERHDIPMLDYDALSLESLVNELKNLVTNEKVMSVKDHVEEIKKSFLAKYYHFLDEKKEEFLAENPDTNEEFQYHSPLKAQFDQYYSLFRDNKNSHFKSLQTNLKTNLENRLAIVDELK